MFGREIEAVEEVLTALMRRRFIGSRALAAFQHLVRLWIAFLRREEQTISALRSGAAALRQDLQGVAGLARWSSTRVDHHSFGRGAHPGSPPTRSFHPESVVLSAVSQPSW